MALGTWQSSWFVRSHNILVPVYLSNQTSATSRIDILLYALYIIKCVLPLMYNARKQSFDFPIELRASDYFRIMYQRKFEVGRFYLIINQTLVFLTNLATSICFPSIELIYFQVFSIIIAHTTSLMCFFFFFIVLTFWLGSFIQLKTHWLMLRLL